MTKRRAIGLAAGAVALVAFLSPLAATASAATPDSITSAFTPNVIGIGGTSTLSYTITDTNSSGTDSTVGFTDTLPPGLVTVAYRTDPDVDNLSGIVELVREILRDSK